MTYSLNQKELAMKYLERFYTYLEGYRKETATMAINVLNKSEDLSPFSTKESSYEFTEKIIQADEARLVDVSKMLHVLYNELTQTVNYDKETRKLILEQKQRRKDGTLRKSIYRDFK